MFVGAILMDLSKAFGCLPHDLIIENHREYGVPDSICRLIASYFSNRTQRVKIGNVVSPWTKQLREYTELNPWATDIQHFYKAYFYFITARFTNMQMTQSRTDTEQSTL